MIGADFAEGRFGHGTRGRVIAKTAIKGRRWNTKTFINNKNIYECTKVFDNSSHGGDTS